MNANQIPPEFDPLERIAKDLLARGDAIDSIIPFVDERTGMIGTNWGTRLRAFRAVCVSIN